MPDTLGRMRGAPLREKIEAFSEPVAECGCWVWMRACWGSGYGIIKHGNRSMSAHKASFEAFVGPVPDGADVLHHCDVKPCVNPAHLFLGTHADNMQDAAAKGLLRPLPGEANGFAKLTEEAVAAIRRRYVPGEVRQADLAEEFGITQGQVSAIVRGVRWKHTTTQERNEQ